METKYLEAILSAKRAAKEYIREYIRTNGAIKAEQANENYQILYYNHHGEPHNEIIQSVEIDVEGKADIWTNDGYCVSEDDMSTQDVESILMIIQDINNNSKNRNHETT